MRKERNAELLVSEADVCVLVLAGYEPQPGTSVVHHHVDRAVTQESHDLGSVGGSGSSVGVVRPRRVGWYRQRHGINGQNSGCPIKPPALEDTYLHSIYGITSPNVAVGIEELTVDNNG